MPRSGRVFAIVAASAYLIVGISWFTLPPEFFGINTPVKAELQAAHPWLQLFFLGGLSAASAAILGVVMALAFDRKTDGFDFVRWIEGIAFIACAAGMLHFLDLLFALRTWPTAYVQNTVEANDLFFLSVMESQGSDGGSLSYFGIGLWMIVRRKLREFAYGCSTARSSLALVSGEKNSRLCVYQAVPPGVAIKEEHTMTRPA